MSFLYKRHDAFPDSILVRDFISEIDVSDIIDSWEYLLEKKLINDQIKGVINNLEGCRLNMDMNSFQTLINYLKMSEPLRSLKLAVICDNPRLIIFPMMGELMEKDLHIRPFATEKAAVEWIMFG